MAGKRILWQQSLWIALLGAGLALTANSAWADDDQERRGRSEQRGEKEKGKDKADQDESKGRDDREDQDREDRDDDDVVDLVRLDRLQDLLEGIKEKKDKDKHANRSGLDEPLPPPLDNFPPIELPEPPPSDPPEPPADPAEPPPSEPQPEPPVPPENQTDPMTDPDIRRDSDPSFTHRRIENEARLQAAAASGKRAGKHRAKQVQTPEDQAVKDRLFDALTVETGL
jgi:hypothetical protein